MKITRSARLCYVSTDWTMEYNLPGQGKGNIKHREFGSFKTPREEGGMAVPEGSNYNKNLF